MSEDPDTSITPALIHVKPVKRCKNVSASGCKCFFSCIRTGVMTPPMKSNPPIQMTVEKMCSTRAHHRRKSIRNFRFSIFVRLSRIDFQFRSFISPQSAMRSPGKSALCDLRGYYISIVSPYASTLAFNPFASTFDSNSSGSAAMMGNVL